MVLLINAPLLSLVLFSIAPLIGGLKGYKNAREDEDNLEQAMRGAGIGLLIDIPFLLIVLWLFSSM